MPIRYAWPLAQQHLCDYTGRLLSMSELLYQLSKFLVRPHLDRIMLGCSPIVRVFLH